jgi:hypothetical protein
MALVEESHISEAKSESALPPARLRARERGSRGVGMPLTTYALETPRRGAGSE